MTNWREALARALRGLPSDEDMPLTGTAGVGRPPTPQEAETGGALARSMLVPESPLDAAFMVAGGLPGRVGKGALAAYGALETMSPSEAEGGPLQKLVGALRRIQSPIKAYHGSPHDFDAFDMSKIGTGEGAQAYGHGLYFAENPKVAEGYRYVHGGGMPTVDAVTYMGNEISGLSGIGKAGLRPAGSGGPLDVAGLHGFPASGTDGSIANFGLNTTPAKLKDVLPAYNDEQIKALQMLIQTGGDGPKAAEILRAKGLHAAAKIVDETAGEFSVLKKNTGDTRMYEVNLHAPREAFLDWDRPLAQQGEHVRQTLLKEPFLDTAAMREWPGSVYEPPSGPWQLKGDTGQDFYRQIAENQMLNRDRPVTGLVAQHSAKVSAADALKEAGIPGIKYLDQGSRGAGTGTSNFVVFDPGIIEILRKYGLLPAAATGAAGAMMPDEASAYDDDKRGALARALRGVE